MSDHLLLQPILSDDEIDNLYSGEIYRKLYDKFATKTSKDDLKTFTNKCFSAGIITIQDQQSILSELKRSGASEAFGTLHDIVGRREECIRQLIKIFCSSGYHKSLIKKRIKEYRDEGIRDNKPNHKAFYDNWKALSKEPTPRKCTMGKKDWIMIGFTFLAVCTGVGACYHFGKKAVGERDPAPVPLQNDTGTEEKESSITSKGGPGLMGDNSTLTSSGNQWPSDPGKELLEYLIAKNAIPESCRDHFDPQICTGPTTSQPSTTTRHVRISDRNNSSRFVAIAEYPSQVRFYHTRLCNSTELIMEFSTHQATSWSSMNVECFENLYGIKISGSMSPDDLHFVVNAAPNIRLLTLEGDGICESFYDFYVEERNFSRVDLKHLRILQFNNLSECLGLINFISNVVNLESLSTLMLNNVYVNNILSADAFNFLWKACHSLEHFSFMGGQLCDDCTLFQSRKRTLKSICFHPQDTKIDQSLFTNLTFTYNTKLEKVSTNVSLKSGDVDKFVKRNPLLVDLEINFHFDNYTRPYLSMKSFRNLTSLRSIKLTLTFSELCRCVSQKDVFKLTNIRLLSVSSLSVSSNCKVGPGQGWRSLGMEYNISNVNGLWNINVLKVVSKDVEVV